MPQIDSRELRRLVATFTALAMLFISDVITEDEFISYLKREVCDVQEKQPA